MQQGPWLAKKYVTDYLASDLPTRLIQHRNEWQLDSERLPDPELYVAYEPAGLEVWPTIITIQMATSQIVRTDYANWTTDPNYRVTYNLRTYVWVRGEGPEQTTETRDRLTAVVRASLLDHPAMAANDPGFFPTATSEVRLDETTLREEYSDLSYAKGDRVIAGAFLGYEFSLNEQITRQKLGDVSVIGIDIEQVPLGEDFTS
jgi:hypothetical protein